MKRARKIVNVIQTNVQLRFVFDLQNEFERAEFVFYIYKMFINKGAAALLITDS